MESIKNHKVNTFCWADLATTDKKSAIKFYTDIFGWKSIENDTVIDYDMFTLQGKAVAAVCEMMPELKKAEIPPYWMSHIAVDNIEKYIAKVEDCGGTVISGALMTAGDNGLFALIQDPENALIGLWEGKTHKGAAFTKINSTLCWVEHAGRNASLSVPFYEKVFSWTSKTENFGDMPYTTFYSGGEPVAGLYIMNSDMDSIPCHWLPYFMIENIELAIEKTKKYHGSILMPKLFIEHVGFFTVIRDPQGAVFGLIQSE